MLAYFSASVEQRKNSSTRIVGFLGVIIGAAFHPYWIYFPTLTIVFSYFLRGLDGTRTDGFKETLTMTPFEMIGAVEAFWTRFRVSHMFADSTLFLVILVAVGILLIARRRGKSVFRFTHSAITLYVLAVVPSFGVSVL